MQDSRAPGRWTAAFLISTVATSATGFLFPFRDFLPSHGVAVLSLVVLPVAMFAVYGKRLAGGWRLTYVITAMLALYLNVFVLVVQGFLKVPVLKEVAPTQAELPFLATQGVVFAAFVVATVIAAVRFRPEGRESVADLPSREPGSRGNETATSR